ncbi:19751_t:CDS:1, partial [Racocetra fulgida]
SVDEHAFTGSSSPHDHHDISPLISSQLNRKESSGSSNCEKDFTNISRKNARMSIISSRDKPIIKVTTSTSSFRIPANLTDDEFSDTDENLPPTNNNKVIKSGNFVVSNNNNEKKKKKVTLIDGDQKASVRFQQRQQELLKQKQKSLALMIGDNGNYDTRTTQQFPNIINQ